jgi:hypothetical protein
VKNRITAVCEEIKNMLIEKNEAYGNSAAEPVRVFSKSDNLEQIRVRIDDKLSRIAKSGEDFDDEDTVLDLIGYLVLYRAVRQEPYGPLCVDGIPWDARIHSADRKRTDRGWKLKKGVSIVYVEAVEAELRGRKEGIPAPSVPRRSALADLGGSEQG